MHNPRVDRMKVLGTTLTVYTAAHTALLAYLDAHNDQEEVAEAAVRAAVVPAVSDRVWNELKKDVGLVG